MTSKTKVMLWLGAVFASVTIAALFGPLFRPEMETVLIAGTVFTFLAIAFAPTRWWIVAVPGFMLTVMGLQYFRVHRSEPEGLTVLVVTLALNAIVLWFRFKKRRQAA